MRVDLLHATASTGNDGDDNARKANVSAGLEIARHDIVGQKYRSGQGRTRQACGRADIERQ